LRYPRLSKFLNIDSTSFDDALQGAHWNWLVAVNRDNHLPAVSMSPLLMTSFGPASANHAPEPMLKSAASDGASRGLHDLLMSAANQRAGRKLLVAPNGLTHGLALVGVGQTSIDALPERLSKGDSLGKWKCHRFAGELLSGHGGKVAIQGTSVNTGRERK
jgi:hypothetical protein